MILVTRSVHRGNSPVGCGCTSRRSPGEKFHLVHTGWLVCDLLDEKPGWLHAQFDAIRGDIEMDVGAWGESGTNDQRVAEVAHDLRMPLALILAHCEQLASTLVDRDQLIEIDRIRDTASRMGRQVDGLVHATPAPRVPTDVAALVNDVVTRFQPLATARSRQLVLDSPASAVVLASSEDLELALQNVIENALRHARSAPVRVSVHVGLRHVSIDVADDGPGIAAGQAPRRSRGADAGLARRSGQRRSRPGTQHRERCGACPRWPDLHRRRP